MINLSKIIENVKLAKRPQMSIKISSKITKNRHLSIIKSPNKYIKSQEVKID